VTVLYCTVANITNLLEGVGLDAMHSLMQALYALVLAEVRQYEGTIQYASGEGFLVLFGAPVAQEDHAWRAILAALGLQRRLRERQPPLRLPSGEAVTLQVALHTGLVVVGEMGDDLHRTAVVVGEAAMLTRTLVRQAIPDIIVASESTVRLLQGEVDAVALPPLRVDGQQAPIAVYQILGGTLRRVPQAASETFPHSPFVGRDTELALLLARLARVELGHGQVVALVGEPGMGKSRLLSEFRQQVRTRQGAYLQGHCRSYGRAIPYLPIVDLLRASWGITEADNPETITTKMHSGLQMVHLAPDIWAPSLLPLFGVESQAAIAASLGREALRLRCFEALHQFYLHSSQHRPHILEIENLHWIDATSEAYIAALVERLAGVPMLLLVTFRPGYQPTWLDKSYVTQIALQPLERNDSRRVVRAVLRHTPLSEARERQLLAKAQGNPFFLEELAHTLLEQRDDTLTMPDTIQAVLAARIDWLPSAEKRLLQTAAVIGTEVPFALLHTITGESEATLQRRLTRLHAAEFLYETRRVPELLYTFKHVLTHEVAYGSLLQEARQALHRQIVEALETLYADRLADHIDQLADHALRGAAWEKACRYFTQAGMTAIARSAYREAVVCFEQAMEALQHLPEHRGTREQAVDLRLNLRNALLPLGENARSLDILRGAEVMAESLDDANRLGWIACYRSVHYFVLGEYEHAITAGQRALALATACDELPLQISAQLRLGQAHHALGNYHQAIEVLKRTALADVTVVDPAGLAGLPAVHARTWLAWCLAEIGAFAEGLTYGEVAVKIAEAVDRPYTLVAAYCGIGCVYLRQGELHQALPLLERALSLCQSADIALAFPTVTALLGAAYARLGRGGEALGLLEQAVAQATAKHILVYRALGLVHLGEAYLLAGRLDEAYEAAQRALAFCQTHQEHGHQAWTFWLLGEIAARRVPCEVTHAEAAYRQAAALAEERGMRPLRAHCHLGLGTLYRHLGDATQARAELTAASMLLQSMDMALWLPRVNAALAAVMS
jgi:class 3 adenylate cyclase/tetratricopeptide (TPR) repeat protein